MLEEATVILTPSEIWTPDRPLPGNDAGFNDTNSFIYHNLNNTGDVPAAAVHHQDHTSILLEYRTKSMQYWDYCRVNQYVLGKPARDYGRQMVITARGAVAAWNTAAADDDVG
jgi:hypothetical protein